MRIYRGDCARVNCAILCDFDVYWPFIVLAATMGPKQNLSSKCQTFFCSGYLLAALSLLLALLLLLTLLLLFSCILKVWHFLFDLLSIFFLLFASILFILFYDFFFLVFFGASMFVYVFYGCWKHCLFVIFSAYTWSVIVANKREGSHLLLNVAWFVSIFRNFDSISSVFRFTRTFHFHIEFRVHLVTCLTRSSSLFFFWCASFLFLLHSLIYLCNKFQYWTRSQTRIKHKFSKILDYYFICMPYSLPSTC